MQNIKDFLLGPYSINFELWDKIFFWAALASAVAGLILALVLFFKKFDPVNQKLLSRIKNLALTFGILGLVWAAFRYEHAIYLEWRLWYVILAAVCAVWKFRILGYLVRNYRADLKNLENLAIKQKYLSR